MMIVTVLVGFTSTRPIVPDEHHVVTRVAVEWDGRHETQGAAEVEATLIAAQMAHCIRGSEMPTSTEILEVEL